MSKALAHTAYAIADGLGLNWLLRARSRDAIAVLMYHGVAPDDAPIDAWTLVRMSEFRWQMQYLQAHCDVLSIADVAARKSSSRPQVMITFDDGYRSNYLQAYPVLRELQLPATIFVATGFVDTTNLFWYDKIIHALQASRCRSIDLSEGGLGVFELAMASPERRWADIQAVLTAVKIHDAAGREILAERIARGCQVASGDMQWFQALTREDIVALHADPLISFGSHTHGHEILTQLSAAQARATIERSLAVLRDLLGEDCRLFSYPNGNFNEELMALLQAMSIRYSFTTEKGFWSKASNPRAIPRIGVGGYDSRAKFAALVSGLSLMR